MTDAREGRGKALSHAAAIDAICGCARTVSVLSYQEAIEGYLNLRGLGSLIKTPAEWTCERQDGDDGEIYYAIHARDDHRFIANVYSSEKDAQLIASAPTLSKGANNG